MHSHRIRPALAVALFLGALLVGCGEKSEPAPSGVSKATGIPTATATATSTAAATQTPATALTGEQLEVQLMKALLQRGDIPGDAWIIQDVGMKAFAAATGSADAQRSMQTAQSVQAACLPGQPPTSVPTSAEGVMRMFILPPDGLSSVISSALRTPDAQTNLKANQEARFDPIRACLEAELQKSVAAEIPGATVRLIQADAVTGMPSNMAGSEIVTRITVGSVSLTQRIGTLVAAQGDVLVTTSVITMAEGTAIPLPPAPLRDLATLSARRLSEATR